MALSSVCSTHVVLLNDVLHFDISNHSQWSACWASRQLLSWSTRYSCRHILVCWGHVVSYRPFQDNVINCPVAIHTRRVLITGHKYKPSITRRTLQMRQVIRFVLLKYLWLCLFFGKFSWFYSGKFGGGFLLGWGAVPRGGTGYEKFCMSLPTSWPVRFYIPTKLSTSQMLIMVTITYSVTPWPLTVILTENVFYKDA